MAFPGNNIVGWYQDASSDDDGFIATLPEPSTLALLSVGAIGLTAYAWRKRRKVITQSIAEESPAILSFPSRSFEAKRRAV